MPLQTIELSFGVDALRQIKQMKGDVRARLAELGDVFADFGDAASGCIAHGVQVGETRCFVKHPLNAMGCEAQARASAVHAAVQHSVLVPVIHRLDGDLGPILIYPWIEGVRLREAQSTARMELAEVLVAIGAVIDVHVSIEAAGFVSVDLYDGNLLYSDRIHLIDVDEYRPTPYTRSDERFLGSKRFMAPEEFRQGATLDSRTMVFQLGRTAAVLLNPPLGADCARAKPVAEVIGRATSHDPAQRFQTVGDLRRAWLARVADLGLAGSALEPGVG